MRITILIQEDGNNIAGPVINQQRLAHQYRIMGHNVQILCLYSKSSPILENLKSKGFICAKSSVYLDTKITIRWLIKQVNSFKTDFFVCDWIVPGILASRWIRKSGIPCVCSHLSDDPYFWSIMNYFASSSSKKWQISGIVCVSKKIQSRVIKLYKPRHTFYIPQSCNVSSYKISDFSNLRIVYCGRIEVKQKQIVKLTNAFCDIVQNIPNSKASIYGNGTAEDEVLNVINSRNCSDKVNFLGPINPQKIQHTLKNYNVIVHLSDYEGIPASILDGMSVGLVPVCLKCPGGIEELVIDGKTGLLVNDRFKDFEKNLLKLSRNKDLFAYLSNSAFIHVNNNYTVKIVAQKWLDFFFIISKQNSFKKVKLPLWIKLPKIKEEGFIIENYSTLQFFIYLIRVYFGKFLKIL